MRRRAGIAHLREPFGLFDGRGDLPAEHIRREGDEASPGEAITEALIEGVQPPPGVQDQDAGPALLRCSQIGTRFLVANRQHKFSLLHGYLRGAELGISLNSL